MAKVHFAPYEAIKYVGSKSKEFSASLARPKPTLKKGDIIIVDKKTAFNLTVKGFGEFVEVEDISFTKSDIATEIYISELKEKLKAYENENNALFSAKVELNAKLKALNDELLKVDALSLDTGV